MNSTSDEFLAGAAFTNDHHGQFSVYDTRHRPVDFLHRRRTPSFPLPTAVSSSKANTVGTSASRTVPATLPSVRHSCVPPLGPAAAARIVDETMTGIAEALAGDEVGVGDHFAEHVRARLDAVR